MTAVAEPFERVEAAFGAFQLPREHAQSKVLRGDRPVSGLDPGGSERLRTEVGVADGRILDKALDGLQERLLFVVAQS